MEEVCVVIRSAQRAGIRTTFHFLSSFIVGTKQNILLYWLILQEYVEYFVIL